MPTTTGLSCQHIRRVSRTHRTETHTTCALPQNSGRRCGPGYPLCPLFQDRREVPFGYAEDLIDPEEDISIL